jgi:hypothetical protein
MGAKAKRASLPVAAVCRWMLLHLTWRSGVSFQPCLSPRPRQEASRLVDALLWPRLGRIRSSEGDEVDLLFQERFRRRKSERQKLIQAESDRCPPNANLSVQETVEEVLESLRRPHYPQRYFGILILLRTSMPSWRSFLCRSVGAPLDEDNRVVAEALEAAMSRPHNQFRILLGQENDGYQIDFATDPVDYGDGQCWLECRLRCHETDDLLVALGWSLVRSDDAEQAWRIDGLDWQDFRDAYRPGIGREEWERICG